MRRLLEWVSTLADTFQSNSHPEFDDTVKAEFNDAFPHLTAAKVKLENGTSVERASHVAVGVVVCFLSFYALVCCLSLMLLP